MTIRKTTIIPFQPTYSFASPLAAIVVKAGLPSGNGKDMSVKPKALKNFKYLSFDVVGTLIDFETAMIDGIIDVAGPAAAQIDPNEIFAVYRATRVQEGAKRCPDDLGRCYGAIAAHFGLADTEAKRKAMIEALAEAKPFPDSVDALARLKKHYKLIAMTNAQRWGFERYEKKLGSPFWAGFTSDETNTEKPDPAFFHMVFDYIKSQGDTQDDILHAAQSQHHDIGIARSLGLTNVWIQRRHEKSGYGGSLEPDQFTTPDYHFKSMKEFADAVDAAFGAADAA